MSTRTTFGAVYDTLVAAVLIAVDGFRKKTRGWTSITEKLNNAQNRFTAFKELNPACPIFENAITLLDHCNEQKVTFLYLLLQVEDLPCGYAGSPISLRI